jgi:hypothetical protein
MGFILTISYIYIIYFITFIPNAQFKNIKSSSLWEKEVDKWSDQVTPLGILHGHTLRRVILHIIPCRTSKNQHYSWWSLLGQQGSTDLYMAHHAHGLPLCLEALAWHTNTHKSHCRRTPVCISHQSPVCLIHSSVLCPETPAWCIEGPA